VTSELAITGMTCGHCVKHVDRALRGVPGVTAVDVRLADQLAVVTHGDDASVPAMVAVVTAAGYHAAPR
jgi:copper chaperone